MAYDRTGSGGLAVDRARGTRWEGRPAFRRPPLGRAVREARARTPPKHSQPSSKGKVMRARHRHFLVTLIAAIAVALLAPSAAPGQAEAITCPGSTSWDNLLQRCV